MILFAAFETIHLVNTSTIFSFLHLPRQLDSFHHKVPPLSVRLVFRNIFKNFITYYHENVFFQYIFNIILQCIKTLVIKNHLIVLIIRIIIKSAVYHFIIHYSLLSITYATIYLSKESHHFHNYAFAFVEIYLAFNRISNIYLVTFMLLSIFSAFSTSFRQRQCSILEKSFFSICNREVTTALHTRKCFISYVGALFMHFRINGTRFFF